jgi:hypothetical protein
MHLGNSDARAVQLLQWVAAKMLRPACCDIYGEPMLKRRKCRPWLLTTQIPGGLLPLFNVVDHHHNCLLFPASRSEHPPPPGGRPTDRKMSSPPWITPTLGQVTWPSLAPNLNKVSRTHACMQQRWPGESEYRFLALRQGAGGVRSCKSSFSLAISIGT